MKLNRVLAVFTFLGFLVACQRGSADALDNWQWLNPLPTGNSLNGITFAANLFVAVGDDGVVVNSPNGTNWVSGSSQTTSSLSSVTYGNGLWVAVGTNGVVQTSPDGSHWSLRVSGTAAGLVSVTFGNGQFVAVGASGTIIASADGVNWTAGNSGVTSSIISVAWGNGVFVAVGSGAVFHSSDGITWTSESLNGVGIGPVVFANGVFIVEGTDYQYYSAFLSYYRGFAYVSSDGITWNADGDFTYENSAIPYSYPFITFGSGRFFDASHVSTDGQTWNNAANTGFSSGNACAFGNGTFVAVGENGTILTSPSGSVWTGRTPGAQSLVNSIAYGNGTYVAVGENYVTPPNVYPDPAPTGVVLFSTNGLPCQTPVTAFVNDPLSAVIFTNGTFTAVGQSGVIIQSQNGVTWTQRNSGTAHTLYSLTAGSGQLVAVGDNGTILTSSTGAAWTARFSGTSDDLYGVICADGLYVAVGYEGTIMTSPDGLSWTAQYSGIATDLCKVTYGAAGFVAGGAGGVIVTSPDGVNWTVQNSGTGWQINSLSYGNGYYVAVGTPYLPDIYYDPAASVTLTSLDGVAWTPHTTPAAGDFLLGTAFLNNQFFLVGGSGYFDDAGTLVQGNAAILASGNTATNPLSLQIQAKAGGMVLDVFAPVGSGFRLQATTTLTPANWSDIAAFSNVLAATQWTEPAANLTQRFYRAVSP